MADDKTPIDLQKVKLSKQEQQLATLTAEIDYMYRSMPKMVECHKLLAQLKRSQFEAYVNAGFTAEQALELCKS